jgi:hypothetical protein
MVNGFGEYAVVVSVRAPATMDTVAVDGDGALGVLLPLLLLPHEANVRIEIRTALRR